MISSVEDYLAELKKELAGSDRATIQDALADAEEYLRNALSNGPAGPDTLSAAIEKYGTPAEIAAAYQQVESLTPPAFTADQRVEPKATAESTERAARVRRPWYVSFFGVFAEPRAWGALLYCLLALVTGTFYFTWAVTGLSVSAGLLVLIVGLPIAFAFLLSVRGIALIEGRLVEALLNVRMPRRPRYSEKKTGIWQRFKNTVSDQHTWFSVIYMLLQLPLGVAYFSVMVSLVATSLSIVAWPIVSIAFGVPFISTPSTDYYATAWLIPITTVAGGLLLTATMHIAKAIGKGHGAMAKALLVRA